MQGNRFAQVSAANFSKIPGSPIAYWVSENMFKLFNSNQMNIYATAKTGIGSGNTEYFLKLWHEIDFGRIKVNATPKQIAEIIYAPINKGGNFRRWYGNNEYVIKWTDDGLELKNYKDENGKNLSYPRNLDYQLKESLTWGDVTSGATSVRYSREGFFFSDVGNSLFVFDDRNKQYILGLLNTVIFDYLKKVLNTTMHFKPGNMLTVPILLCEEKTNDVGHIVDNNISLSHSDWDSYETSWDFKRHPLI